EPVLRFGETLIQTLVFTSQPIVLTAQLAIFGARVGALANGAFQLVTDLLAGEFGSLQAVFGVGELVGKIVGGFVGLRDFPVWAGDFGPASGVDRPFFG